jgi:hypothetical protein
MSKRVKKRSINLAEGDTARGSKTGTDWVTRRKRKKGETSGMYLTVFITQLHPSFPGPQP